MTAMTRTFRNRVLPFWYWRRHANRLDRIAFDDDAEVLFERFTTPPTTARKNLINARILAAKASGAWALRDGFYMMAAANAQAAQRNWKADAYNLTPSGATPPTFEADRGYTGDGVSGYLDTGFAPDTNGVQFTLNAAHMSVWSRTNAQSTGVAIGCRTSAAVGQTIITIRNADLASFRINQITSPATVANTNSSGLFVVRRTGAAANDLTRNGVSLGSNTVASTTRSTANIVIGGLNTGGVVSNFNNYQFASAGYGGNLSNDQILAEYNADLAYLQGVGAA